MSAPAEACASGGCGEPVFVKKWGLCRRHYNELRDQGVIKRAPKKECRFKGCRRRAVSGGLCNSHLSQKKRGKELTPLGRPRERGDELAEDQEVPACGVPSRWTGLPCGKPAGKSGQCAWHLSVYQELVRS